MPRLKKLKKAVDLLLVVGLLATLVGCGGSNQNQAKEVKPEDSIIRITEDWPVFIDPGVGSKFSDSIALVNTYDTLVFPKPDGTVVPHLATKWDILDNGLTYRFYLREGVKFHNGDELTAEDVEFSMKRLLDIGEGFAYLFTRNVAEVKAVDKYTVEFKLSQPFGPFLQSLVRLYILNKDEVLAHIQKNGQYGEMGDYGKNWLLTNDAGSGPYKVKEVKMEEYVIWEKFDDYWGGWDADAPKYFKLSGSVEPITVRTAVGRRELEITDELQPLENYNMMDKIEGVDVATFLNGHNLNMMLNTKKAPTDDVHFRRALAYCIDYDAIITSIYPGSSLSKGPVPAVLPGHDPTIPSFKRDLEKAKEELKKSKYYGKLDQYPVSLSWCAEAPEEEKLALLIQANAAELGIKIEITKKPFGSMMADAQKMETTPNASLVFVAPHYNEAGSMLMSRYHSSSCGTWEQMEWLQDENIDRLIEDALATVDINERFEKYAKAQKAIFDLCPTIWLFDQAEKRAYQSAYIYWPTAERALKKETGCLPMGYDQYVHDMKVYPEKRLALL